MSTSTKNPLFIRFINKETSVTGMLKSFSKTGDKKTSQIALKVLLDPPEMDEFRKELEEAVRDLVKDGVGEEFKAFVNHYMSTSLEEFTEETTTPFGENRSQTASVRDEKEPWVEGLLCYNTSLYIKAFGLGALKICKICGKLFCHKGKYAVYCSELCKSKKNN